MKTKTVAWEGNPYSEPEKCGLEIIGTLQDETLSYEFDIFCVWQDKATKRFYYLSDSGCSCPSPFETIHCINELNAFNSAKALKEALDSWNKDYDRRSKVDPTAIAALVAKFKEAKG